MNQDRIKNLLLKYKAGEVADDELLEIEHLLEREIITLEDVGDLASLGAKVNSLETPSPSVALDDQFYAMLAQEKRKAQHFNWREWFSVSEWMPRVAIATLVFIAGMVLSYIIFHDGKSTDHSDDVATLSNEVKSLKEMMMLSLLEKESATDRLKAVSMSEELSASSEKVINALIQTLNKDENVNVRLAALDALKPYSNKSEVRQALIKSIAKQESPLVQIALADLMASLQEKSSVQEFDKVLKDRKTPGEVKKRIRQSIDVLI